MQHSSTIFFRLLPYCLGILLTLFTFSRESQAQCIGDVTSPTVVCQGAQTIHLDSTGVVSLPAIAMDAGSSDSCGIETYTVNSLDTIFFDCAAVGAPINLYLVVTDTAGNADSCLTTITVLDSLDPVLNCPSTLIGINLDASGLAILDPVQLAIPFIDNCPAVSWKINGQVLDTFDCTDMDAFIPVQIEVTDSSGNNDVCGITIEVTDNILPDAQCAAAGTVVVAIGAGGSIAFPENQVIAASSDNCGITSVLINGIDSLNLTCADVGIYPYTAIVSDTNGNNSSCQSQIEVQWGAFCGFAVQVDTLAASACDSLLCTGYAALSTNGGTGAITYLWNDSSTLNPRSGLCVGQYFVIATDTAGNQDTVNFTIGNTQGCVWPGDTDDNTIANNFDLLPIALAYGSTGSLRPSATTIWEGQGSPDWSIINPIVGLPDYKHIDCNGDALIDSFDVDAINLNYAQSYLRNFNALPDAQTSFDPPIYVGCDTASEGDVNCMGIYLGNSVAQAVNAYAVAYTINYDPLLIDSARIFYTGSWLGAPNETIDLQKDFPSDGKIESAIGRIDHQSVTGFGQIGTVCFTIRDDILKQANPDTTVMPIVISNVRYIDEAGLELPISSFDGCLTIIEVLDGVSLLEDEGQKINVYPNPSRGVVQIDALDLELERIIIRDVTGKTVKQIEAIQQNRLEVNLQDLENGLYFIHIQTKNGFANKRLIISKK